MKHALRAFSLPLLHRGDRLRTSVSFWFLVLTLAAACGLLAKGHFGALGLAATPVAFLYFAFWFSARRQRELSLRRLAAHSCPGCGAKIGKETASMAFADYTRSCLDFIGKSKGAFSIDLGSPLDFSCPQCSKDLFFDYIGSGELSVNEDDAPTPSSETHPCP